MYLLNQLCRTLYYLAPLFQIEGIGLIVFWLIVFISPSSISQFILQRLGWICCSTHSSTGDVTTETPRSKLFSKMSLFCRSRIIPKGRRFPRLEKKLCKRAISHNFFCRRGNLLPFGIIRKRQKGLVFDKKDWVLEIIPKFF